MTRAEIKEKGLSINKNGIVEDEYGNEYRDESESIVKVEPLKNCLGLCPMCESDDIKYEGGSNFQDDSLSYSAECNSCGKFFTEWYDIKYSETIG